MERVFVTVVFISVLLGGCSEPPDASSAADTESADYAAHARELTQRLLIVDTHIDVPYRLYKGFEDVSEATQTGNFDYPRAIAGGLNAPFMSIFVPADIDAAGDAKAFADNLIDSIESLVAHAPEKFAIASCTADVYKISADGKIALPLGMENGGPIEGSFAGLRHFAERGIRYITLTHSKSNHISDSSYDTNEPWAGLSPFGQTLIPEMNRQGVMVDISHVSDKAFWQVLELTQTPVIASHSSLRHFTPGFQRNMTDDMVVALGENNGVIQITFGSSFLSAATRTYSETTQQALLSFVDAQHLSEDDPRLLSFAETYLLEHPYPYASVEDVLNHIDRVVELAGIDHVGLGSDFDGVGDTLPMGLKDVAGFSNLVAGLLRRGYADDDIEKILSANIMRVWTQVERYAAAQGNPTQCRQTSG